MIHSTSYTVTFAGSFTLPGLDRAYPAGTYTVQAEDEQLDLSFAASRRVATSILLTAGATTRALAVKPADLEAALAMDATNRQT